MKSILYKFNIPLIICFIAILIIFIYTSVYIIKVTNLQKIFRIHVISNSLDVNDQITKLKLSNILLDYINNNIDKNDVSNSLKNNLNEIQNICDKFIKENNIDYSYNIKFGSIKYEEKENMYIKMDKGTYNSIQVVLGNGEGNNFFDLLLPKKEDIENISKFETIIPNISNLFENDLSKPKEKIKSNFFNF
ncbi:MAG: stage II sporulation protein R [Clostridia bacterium]